MKFNPELRLDPDLKDVAPAETKGMVLRACCVCGAVREVEVLKECITCDGYKCPEHVVLPGLVTLN